MTKSPLRLSCQRKTRSAANKAAKSMRGKPRHELRKVLADIDFIFDKAYPADKYDKAMADSDLAKFY